MPERIDSLGRVDPVVAEMVGQKPLPPSMVKRNQLKRTYDYDSETVHLHDEIKRLAEELGVNVGRLHAKLVSCALREYTEGRLIIEVVPSADHQDVVI